MVNFNLTYSNLALNMSQKKLTVTWVSNSLSVANKVDAFAHLEIKRH